MRVLVIEDNPKMAAVLERGLAEHGFAVDVCSDGYDAEEMAAAEPYDTIILDLMLPQRDGRDICANLRRRGVKTPVLMLTALSATRDKVAGFDAGADDYLCKPFEFDELLARLRALMRRVGEAGASVLRHAGVEMNLARRRVTRDGQPIDLTHKEFALLEYLLRNPGAVLSRAAIGSHVWDMNFDPMSNVIDVYISTLRKKLDKPFDQPMIHTVVGAGYRFGLDRDDHDADDEATPHSPPAPPAATSADRAALRASAPPAPD